MAIINSSLNSPEVLKLSKYKVDIYKHVYQDAVSNFHVQVSLFVKRGQIKCIYNPYDMGKSSKQNITQKGYFEMSVAGVVIGLKLCREITSKNETFCGGHLDP